MKNLGRHFIELVAVVALVACGAAPDTTNDPSTQQNLGGPTLHAFVFKFYSAAAFPQYSGPADAACAEATRVPIAGMLVTINDADGTTSFHTASDGTIKSSRAVGPYSITTPGKEGLSFSSGLAVQNPIYEQDGADNLIVDPEIDFYFVSGFCPNPCAATAATYNNSSGAAYCNAPDDNGVYTCGMTGQSCTFTLVPDDDDGSCTDGSTDLAQC